MELEIYYENIEQKISSAENLSMEMVKLSKTSHFHIIPNSRRTIIPRFQKMENRITLFSSVLLNVTLRSTLIFIPGQPTIHEDNKTTTSYDVARRRVERLDVSEELTVFVFRVDDMVNLLLAPCPSVLKTENVRSSETLVNLYRSGYQKVSTLQSYHCEDLASNTRTTFNETQIFHQETAVYDTEVQFNDFNLKRQI
jgi:hypothetical protein